MSRKRAIPGVDEAALSALAGQFPSGNPHQATPPAPAAAPPIQDNTPPAQDDTPAAQDKALPAPGDTPPIHTSQELDAPQPVPPAAPEVLRRRAPGRGLAVCAMLLALLAILISASAVMPPSARLWLTRILGDTVVVDFLTASRADVDKRLAAAAQSIEALAGNEAIRSGKESEITARLDAVETVVGSGAALRRLDAVEAGLKAADQRLAAADAERTVAGDAERTASARAEALDAKVSSFDSSLKTIQDKLAAAERDLGDILAARLGAVEANVGELQKVDRRPEKFFLAALQLRDLARTSNPFAREVAAAQALAGTNPELVAALKVLAGDAGHGVATVGELRQDFSSLVAPRLAALSTASRQPIAAQAWGWVQSLFATNAGGAAGDRNAAVLALAARSLDQGQLEAAVHQLLLLEDEAALVAGEWLKNASARLAADKAIATIMSQALDQLAASN